MTSQAHTALLHLFCNGLGLPGADRRPVAEANLDAKVLQAELPGMRYAPLAYGLAEDGVDMPERLRETFLSFQPLYYQRLVEGQRKFNFGLRIARLLEAAGIPCICYRGPFSGALLYGDHARRNFGDVDLIIPRNRIEDSYELLQASGRDILHADTPRGFFLRHHLHWVIGRHGEACDLHWAVEHPYTLFRINYDAIFARSRVVEADGQRWREPHPEHMLLLMGLQVCKANPKVGQCLRDEYPATAMQGKLLWKWLDAALVFTRFADEMDMDRLWAEAEAWQAASQLATLLDGLDRAMRLDTPPLNVEPFHGSPRRILPARIANQALMTGGFRSEAVWDALRFLWPPLSTFKGYGGPVAWAAHVITAPFKLAFAALDGLCASLIAKWRSRRTKAAPSATAKASSAALNLF